MRHTSANRAQKINCYLFFAALFQLWPMLQNAISCFKVFIIDTLLLQTLVQRQFSSPLTSVVVYLFLVFFFLKEVTSFLPLNHSSVALVPARGPGVHRRRGCWCRVAPSQRGTGLWPGCSACTASPQPCCLDCTAVGSLTTWGSEPNVQWSYLHRAAGSVWKHDFSSIDDISSLSNSPSVYSSTVTCLMKATSPLFSARHLSNSRQLMTCNDWHQC